MQDEESGARRFVDGLFAPSGGMAGVTGGFLPSAGAGLIAVALLVLVAVPLVEGEKDAKQQKRDAARYAEQCGLRRPDIRLGEPDDRKDEWCRVHASDGRKLSESESAARDRAEAPERAEWAAFLEQKGLAPAPAIKTASERRVSDDFEALLKSNE